jgi:hypothetical protein
MGWGRIAHLGYETGSWRNKMEVQEMNAYHEHDKGEDKLDLNKGWHK